MNSQLVDAWVLLLIIVIECTFLYFIFPFNSLTQHDSTLYPSTLSSMRCILLIDGIAALIFSLPFNFFLNSFELDCIFFSSFLFRRLLKIYSKPQTSETQDMYPMYVCMYIEIRYWEVERLKVSLEKPYDELIFIHSSVFY